MKSNNKKSQTLKLKLSQAKAGEWKCNDNNDKSDEFVEQKTNNHNRRRRRSKASIDESSSVNKPPLKKANSDAIVDSVESSSSLMLEKSTPLPGSMSSLNVNMDSCEEDAQDDESQNPFAIQYQANLCNSTCYGRTIRAIK